MLPELIMCEPDEFDALWDEFVEEITPSATVFGEYMWEQVQKEAAKVLDNQYSETAGHRGAGP
jgi:hypothetical protein